MIRVVTSLPLTLALTVALTLAITACAEPSSETADSDPSTERRAPLGKADATGSCEDSCDAKSADGNCYCDELCEFYGDCCGDKTAICDGAAFCGGIAGLPCPDGMYCAYDELSGCGFADGGGTCAVKPEACIELFAPVCGCNGETFGNSCKAAQAGITVKTDGECGGAPAPGGSADSCEGACGSSAGDCWCDDACVSFGDCCADIDAFCN